MAVYNGERYIAEAIESVLGQTHEDFEFVIVNDGSTDRTLEIIERYTANDERIRVISHANMDQPASLNRGLAAATHEWVATIDADDIWMPHRLETQLRVLQGEPSIRVLGSFAVWMDENGRGRGIRVHRPQSISEFKRFIERNGRVGLIHPSALMHRPTVLALGGYDPAFGPAADSELWSRVSDEHMVVSLPEPLLYYRVHPASMSMTRCFEQLLMLRWIDARQHARRQGLPQTTLEEYRNLHILRRLDYGRQDWGEYLARSSTLEWCGGHHLRALLIRVVALALTPLQFTNWLSSRIRVFMRHGIRGILDRRSVAGKQPSGAEREKR